MMRFLLPAALDATTAIYIGIGLAACVLVLIVWSLLRRRSRTQSPNENLLDAIIERQGSGRSRSLPRRAAGGGPQLSALEGHLRNAILDPNARERLVKDAMRITGGGRAAAIRKVLRDLGDEDKRWS